MGRGVKPLDSCFPRDGVGWVNSAAELDDGQRDFGHLISSKSVAVAVNFVTRTGGHGPTFESCRPLWRATRPPQLG